MQVTAVIINYRTPELTGRAASSLRSFYPDLPILLIDNGSGPEGLRALEAGVSGLSVTLHPNTSNIHHGPAMDQGIRMAKTPGVLLLDSDCVVRRGGFVEMMAGRLEADPASYAAGKLVMMDSRGFDLPRGAQEGAIPYLRPICLLLKRDTYLTLPPFRKHGSPALENMKAAQNRHLRLVDIPVEEYIDHLGRGTAGRYGYNLGFRGKLNYFLHKLGL